MLNLNNLLMNGLLGQLRTQNPQSYQQVMGLINSGKSPEQVLNELLSSGVFTQDQVNQAKNIVNQQNNGTGNKRF